MLSDKKIFVNFINYEISVGYIEEYLKKFSLYFWAHRFDNTSTAIKYVWGLLICNKGEANMERMEEEVGNSEYRAYQQFITNSNWDCAGLLKSVAIETSALLQAQKAKNKLPVGYIIDESAHLKKGKESVGVSRQYAGVAGKVDNCQVGVYASLVNDKHATIINERLFLPKAWIEDQARCEKAGIPAECRDFKTKPQLALELIKQDIERGVVFDWVGGDGLYGHSYELCDAIDEIGKLFVLDVHKDEKVFLEEPAFAVPEKKPGKGRTPEKLKADKPEFRLDKIYQSVKVADWKLEEIRDSTKGKLYLYVYKTDVWSWDGESGKAKRRTLIITKTTEKTPKVKYSFSNGGLNQYSDKEYAYFISQRYWVERTFDNAKNELGMSDYQVRKWKSWEHHHSLIMLTSLFLMQQQIDMHPEIPLLSFRDARILIILQTFGTKEEVKQRLMQMQKRHEKRQYDIDLNYKLQAHKNQMNLTS
jgi:SRSO17 transposase